MQTIFGPLQFFPTQLDGSEDLCVEFAIDTFVESFGSTEKFFKDNSAKGEGYLRYLQQQIEKDPNSVVHIRESESWKDLGPRADYPLVNFMEKDFHNLASSK